MVSSPLFIHGIDPHGQPKVTAGRDHCFRTCCPSVRPSPLFKSRKTKQQKTMFATGVTVGLAEWIIDDTCLVNYLWLLNFSNYFLSNIERLFSIFCRTIFGQAITFIPTFVHTLYYLYSKHIFHMCQVYGCQIFSHVSRVSIVRGKIAEFLCIVYLRCFFCRVLYLEVSLMYT